MGLEAALSWGILPPDGVQVSWGARVIYTPPTGIDIVHDRQGVQGDGKELKSLVTWVNSKGLKGLKKLLKTDYLGSDERREVAFREGGYVLKADPKASYGYLYLGAWKE